MHTVTPRRIKTNSIYALAVLGPCPPAIAIAWAAGWVHREPTVTLMWFILLVSAAAVAGVSAAMASCHLAIGHAFAAGLQVGQTMNRQAPRPTSVEPRLRVVE